MQYRYRYNGTEPAITGYPKAEWQPGQDQWVDEEIVNPIFTLLETREAPPAPPTKAPKAEVSGNA